MPTYREQIEQSIDEAIRQGRVASTARDQLIQTMASDEPTAQYWAGQMLRAGDYTRKTQELAAQRAAHQAEIEAERQQIQQERSQLEQWQSTAQAEINRLRNLEGQQAQIMAKVGAYEQLLRDYNLTDQIQTGPVSTPPSPSVSYTADHRPAASPQSPQWISREDASQALTGLMDLQGQALKIMAQHQTLFGAPPDDLDELMRTSLQTGQPITDLWRTKHNVEGRQAQMTEQKQAAERAALREQLRSEIISEMFTDPSRLTGGHPLQAQSLPVFDAFGKPPIEGESRATPESRPVMATARQRVEEAADFFIKHFTPDGTPRQTGGPAGLGQ
jgi:hypothetical protein